MADLDDFFAKKDRKKSKNVKKFTTADEVVKKLEDTGKKTDKTSKKDRSNPDDDTGFENHEQDEWKDFEEEKKDYSGLKIGHLSLGTEGGVGSENTGESGGDGGSDNGSNSGEAGYSQSEGQHKGPWKRVHQPEVVVQPQPEPQQPAPVAPTTTGGYVAPALRGSRAAPAPLQSARQRNKAPDIHNEEYFPTLSSTKPDSAGGAWGKKPSRNEGTFEEVRHSRASSGRQAEQRASQGAQGPKLNLGNRFNTLSSTNDS